MAEVQVTKQAGITGVVARYSVVALGDRLSVFRDGEEVASEVVAGLGQFVAGAGELKVGWAETEDFQIIFIYDKADDFFGFALNLSDPALSEFGYAPFAA